MNVIKRGLLVIFGILFVGFVLSSILSLVVEKPSQGHVHTEVIDEAVAATCTDSGLSEGKHCSVCGEVLVAQSMVPAVGHFIVTVSAVSPTCTDTGLTEGKQCSRCGKVSTAQEPVAALGHTEVIDEAKTATCTESGFTEGSHCSRCGEVLVAQSVIPITAHSFNEYGYCSICNYASPYYLTYFEAADHCEVTAGSQCNVSAITIPDTYKGKPVTKIALRGFERIVTLESICFGSNIEVVSNFAFSGCTKLREVLLNEKLVSIYGSAFSGCTSLTNLAFNSGL